MSSILMNVNYHHKELETYQDDDAGDLGVN